MLSGLDSSPCLRSQCCVQLWLAASLLADSVAIAAQAMLATLLSQSDRPAAQAVVRRTVSVGLLIGGVTSAVLGVSTGPLLRTFCSDGPTLAAAASVWPIVVASQPLNTLAFAYDGLIFGGSDFRFCAVAMLAAAVPAAALMAACGRILGLRGVWAGLALLMGLRALAAHARISSRTGPWAVLSTEHK